MKTHSESFYGALPSVNADSPGVSSATLNEQRSVETIQAWLVNNLAESLEIEPGRINIRKPFASYGLGSMQAAGLTGDLATWLGWSLPATLVWDYPNIEALAKRLAGKPGAAETLSGFEMDEDEGDYATL